MPTIDDVLNFIEHSRDEVVRFMIDLIKIRAVNPDDGGTGEYQRAMFIEDWLQKHGAKVSRHNIPDKRVKEGVRVNLTTILEGKDSGRALWFASHLDTVPEGPREFWATDPYEAVVKDGKIFGRGSEDNGQAIASTLFTFKALKTLGIQPPISLGFTCVSDEETGSKYGVIPLLEQGVFKPGDMAIVPDSGSADGSEIEVAEKSLLWLKITTRGKQTHGSTPQKGLNAHRIGMSFALELDAMFHTEYSHSDALFDPPQSTFEPTKHEPNVGNINTVPGLDVQYFDCRILTRYPLANVMKEIESLKVKTERATGATIELTPIQVEENVAPTPIDSEIVQRVRTAIKKLRGIDAKPIGIGGGTVGLYFRRRGIQSVCWSTLDDLAHQSNEYCKIDNIINDAKVFAYAALS